MTVIVASPLRFLYPKSMCSVNFADRRIDMMTPLKDYRMSGLLMEGSTCKIKLAKHIATNTKVCMKIMSKKGNTACFVHNEVEIMRHLHRDAPASTILHLHGLCETDTDYFLILDYMDAGDLFELILRKDRALKNAREICIQVARAVKSCHDADIAHCDIKPENILLSKKGLVKLADFGLARHTKPGQKVAEAVGSLNYLAPEIITRKPYDAKIADIWSLAIVMYAVLTGYLPAGEDGRWDDPKSPAIVGVSAVKDPRARNLLHQMLNRIPEKRITIETVMAHPFLNQGLSKSMGSSSSESSSESSSNSSAESSLSDASKQ